MIKIRDHVERCYTNDEGEKIFHLIDIELSRGNSVTVSFEDSGPVSSSFINSAFVDLASCWGLDTIKQNLKIAHSTNHINEMIRRQVNNYIQSPAVKRFHLQNSQKYDILTLN